MHEGGFIHMLRVGPGNKLLVIVNARDGLRALLRNHGMRVGDP